MSGKYALIIGNNEYTDSGLSQLTAPGKDAKDFASILKDQNVCAFDDVKVLSNELSSTVIEKIDEFFDQKKPDDMLVLYFSGHGVRDESGSLYLAFKNTTRSRLRSTAVKSDYIRDAMDQSRSKRQVLILDCCNSGAFAQGTKAEIGGPMGLMQAFQGYGRFVLTASDATQFAWEGDKVIGSTDNSLFTHFLLKGLEGEADSDSDGKITIDELYDYAYEQVSKVTPNQTPTKSAAKVEGEFVLRQIKHIEDIKRVDLPDELKDEIEDVRPYVREAAVQKLTKILKGKNIGLARSAMDALEKIATDENTTQRIAQEAKRVLEAFRQTTQQAPEESKAIQKTEDHQVARGKVDSPANLITDASSLTNQRLEAMRLAREREQLERQALVTPPTQTTKKELPPQPLKQPQSSKTVVMVVGVAIFCIFFIGGGWALKNFLIPIATLLPSPTVEVSTETPIVPISLPTTAVIPTETTSIPTPTFTPIVVITITSIAPQEPDQFIIFYFDTVITSKDLTKGWALLTLDYQTKKAGGWSQYTAFWGTVKSWTYSNIEVEYKNNLRARVLTTYKLFYNNNSSDLVSGAKYCLLWEPSIRTWQIDLRENCP